MTPKKTTLKKATVKKATAKKATAKKATPARRAAPPPKSAKPGDVIVIDSAQVGSPPREGEVLEVIQGEVSVRYWVKWPDGRKTLIAPVSGSARIVRGSKRT